MQDRCPTDIVIIQGDTYQKNVIIEGVYTDIIEGVYFSCGKLNLTQKLSFNSQFNHFELILSSEQTATLKPVVTDFDITVKLQNDKVTTGLYRGKLIVLDKNNPIQEAF